MARAKLKDTWEFFFSNDFFPETRTIYVGAVKIEHEDKTTINEYNSENLIKALHILEHDGPEKPITIILNTTGGNFYQALAMYDAIKASSCEITVKATGVCMSSGTVILQAGDKRVCTPNTTLMIHDGEDGYHGNPRDLERWADYSKILRTKMYQIYAEKSGQEVAYWRRKCANDYILTAENAKKEGLIDEVV